MKWLLFGMYASRAVMVGGLYLVAPKTDLTFYLFAFGPASWLATVPPTAGLVGKLFGLRYLGTLFGLTLLSHQIGAFSAPGWRPGAGRSSATTTACGSPTSCWRPGCAWINVLIPQGEAHPVSNPRNRPGTSAHLERLVEGAEASGDAGARPGFVAPAVMGPYRVPHSLFSGRHQTAAEPSPAKLP